MGGLKQITEYEKEKRDLDDKKIRKKKSRNHNTTVGTLIGWRRTTQHTVSKAIDVKNSNLDSKKISVGNSKKISNTESRWVSISQSEQKFSQDIRDTGNGHESIMTPAETKKAYIDINQSKTYFLLR